MNALQQLLDSTNTPILIAFILGLMAAISPCPLATNITAVAYISKDIESKRRIFENGLIYTLGRAISYTAIGVIIFFGVGKFEVSRVFSGNGEKVLGPLMLIIGILMLDIINFKLPSFGKLTEKTQQKVKKGSRWNAMFLGIVFALAFCPYSAVLFFGMLLPLTVASASGLYLPVVFAVATGLPVIIIAYLLAFSVSSIGNFYKNIQTFQKWFNRIVAFIFIFVGLYYIYVFYIERYLMH